MNPHYAIYYLRRNHPDLFPEDEEVVIVGNALITRKNWEWMNRPLWKKILDFLLFRKLK